MDISCEWFEGLCDGLSRNPAAATKVLEQFRESDVAVDACLFFIASPNLSSVGMFQAASILQRAIIVRWGYMDASKKAEARKTMVDALTSVATRQSPGFVINKVMQVCASIWKRGWLEIGPADRDTYFEYIGSLMQNGATSKLATSLLRVTLEEFGQQSFAEINTPFAFHADAKRLFQQEDLVKVFNLAVHPLNILFSWQDAAAIAPYTPLMAELFKLLSELITWNFQEDSLSSKNATDDQAMQVCQCNKLPQTWAGHLTDRAFVSNLYGLYQSMCTAPQSFGGDRATLQSCCLELRNLILSLPTIAGDIFASLQEKLTFGTHLLECAVRLVAPFVPRAEVAPLAVSDHSPDYETGGPRHEQLELFVNVFLRLVNNYKVQMFCQMAQFEPTMMQLGAVTVEVCKELSVLAQLSIEGYETWVQQAGPGAAFDMPADVLLMATWRGDVLALCLDAWGVLLESPEVALAAAGIQSASAAQLNPQFLAWLRNISLEIFQHSFQSVTQTLVFETLSGADKEENEEDALIESRETSDLLAGICTLGRASFAAAVEHVLAALAGSTAELQGLAQQPVQVLASGVAAQARCLQALERCRVCVEFGSYLCVETFQPDASQMSHETPVICEGILYQMAGDPGASAKLSALLTQVATLLQWETQIVATHPEHPLQSPLLLQAVYRFLTEYCRHYLDPDPELYSEQCLAIAGMLLQAMHGTSINGVLDEALRCLCEIVTRLPLETDLVTCAAQFLVALAGSHNAARLGSLVESEHIGRLAVYATSLGGGVGSSVGNGSAAVQCRLNGVGLAAVIEAMGQLFVRSKHEGYFTKLCGAVYALLDGKTEVHNRSVFQRLLSALSGLARCPAGQDRILYQLFDASWPTLRASIRLYIDADDLLKQYLLLLQVFAEHQVCRLPTVSCLALYQTAYEVLSIYHTRFSLSDARSPSGGSPASDTDAEGVLFRNESCLHVLELLNQLSNKDFSFTEDCAEQTNQSFEREVAAVLLHGLQLIFPLLTVDTLRNFPVTAERFFSFLAFLTSSYIVDIAQWVNALPPEESRRVLGEILGRLQCGCAAVEAPIARLSLQALQAIATHQWKCLAGQMPLHSKVPFTAGDALVQVTDSLLQAILGATAAPTAGGTNASALLSWDRVDSLGNALITFIALDYTRFAAAAQYLVGLQAASVQPTLLAALTRLSTARGVNMQSIDKPNRQKFLLNFREFVTLIKSLSLS